VYYLSPPHRVHVGSPREPRKRARAIGEPIRMSPNDVADEIGLGSHGSSAASRASPTGADAASRTVGSADTHTLEDTIVACCYHRDRHYRRA
jgi:hypothetical protein